MTKPSNPVIDGVRAFYEKSLALAADEMPDFVGPAFDDLTAEQYRAWILAFAATAEVAVRIGDALTSVGVG